MKYLTLVIVGLSPYTMKIKKTIKSLGKKDETRVFVDKDVSREH